MQNLPIAPPPPTRRRFGDLQSTYRFLAPALRDADCRARLSDISAPAVARFAGTVCNRA
jgi:hypothetical protein